jgi:predicted N-formylglutamate amidohydrolase
LPHVLVEIRQDGSAKPADTAAWAERPAETYAQLEWAVLRLYGCHVDDAEVTATPRLSGRRG